jgi:hypothetical protein
MHLSQNLLLWEVGFQFLNYPLDAFLGKALEMPGISQLAPVKKTCGNIACMVEQNPNCLSLLIK